MVVLSGIYGFFLFYVKDKITSRINCLQKNAFKSCGMAGSEVSTSLIYFTTYFRYVR